MSKVMIRTGDAKDFFARAKAAAHKADRGERQERTMTLSFEDPEQMFAALSKTRRQLLQEVMTESKSISQLVEILQRNRRAVTRDVGKLEELGLLITKLQMNPGHGIQTWVQSVAPQIELVARLC